jgi:hypothetical protein
MGPPFARLASFRCSKPALNEAGSPARRWAVPRLANLNAAQGHGRGGGGNPDASFKQFNAAALDRLAFRKYVPGSLAANGYSTIKANSAVMVRGRQFPIISIYSGHDSHSGA